MERTSRTLCVLIAAGLMIEAKPAHAYIDPGTGSALFYVVTGIIVSAYFGIRGLYYRAVELLFRRRYRHQRCELAVHCEDPRYETTFMPVVQALSRRGVEVTYFTMYDRDASYEPLPAGVTQVAAQEEIAAAGNGGTAEASANGGAVAVGDVNSGGNSGNAIGVGDTVGNVAVDGGAVANSTTLTISANGGTAIADASGGDYNVAFLDEAGFLS